MSAEELELVSVFNTNILSILKMASDHFARDVSIKEQILRARERLILAKNTSYDMLIRLSGPIILKYRELIIGRDLTSFNEQQLNNEITALGKEDKSVTVLKFFGFAKRLYDETNETGRNILFDKLDILLDCCAKHMLLNAS